MKRLVIAIIILFVILTISTVCFIYLNAQVDNLIQLLNVVTQAVENNDINELYIATDELIYLWEKQEGMMSALLNHSELDDLNIELSSLKGYLRTNAVDEYVVSCDRALSILEHIKEMEIPTFGNVF